MAYPCSAILFVFLVMMEVLLSSGDLTSEFMDSRAAYYGSPDGLGTSSGACGYGDYGRDVKGGDVAAASPLLYRNGAGCGACYQVKCKNLDLCSPTGVTLVVTDHGQGDRTDFIMSPHAFTTMAREGKYEQLKALGVVDIEYKSYYYLMLMVTACISEWACDYQGYNIWFKINESSNYPYYLSLVMLHQGGEIDIVAVELSEDKTSGWKAMRRSYGTVWDIVMSPPKGNLALRFQLSGGEWIYARNPVPSNWKAGASYDSGVQIKY